MKQALFFRKIFRRVINKIARTYQQSKRETYLQFQRHTGCEQLLVILKFLFKMKCLSVVSYVYKL